MQPAAGAVRASVSIAPQQRSGGQVDGNHRAGRRGAHQDPVGVRRRSPGQTTQRVHQNVPLDNRKLLRPEEVSRAGVQRQEPDLSLVFPQHVELPGKRQRRTEKKGPCLAQGEPLLPRAAPLGEGEGGGAADVPLQFARANLVRRQPVHRPETPGRSGMHRETSHHDHPPRVRPGGAGVQVLDREHVPTVAAERAVDRITPPHSLSEAGSHATGNRPAKRVRRVHTDAAGARLGRLADGHFPEPFAGGQIDRQQGPRGSHQDHVVHGQRM